MCRRDTLARETAEAPLIDTSHNFELWRKGLLQSGSMSGTGRSDDYILYQSAINIVGPFVTVLILPKMPTPLSRVGSLARSLLSHTVTRAYVHSEVHFPLIANLFVTEDQR